METNMEAPDPNSTSTVPKQNLLKRARIDQDPDYNEAAPPDLKRLKYLEENARSELGEKVKQILTNQFEIEVQRQQNEIAGIDECISKVQEKLQILRYVAARSYYSSKNLVQSTTGSQPVIHPAVKKMIGKSPMEKLSEESQNAESTATTSKTDDESTSLENLKVPRYIPPTLPERVIAGHVRGEHCCVKKKLIIGNVSRWIPVSERDDSASHKWMVYVRGSREEPNISSFVSQVVFFLHPSYAPHDVIRVMSHPFHVTRRGWGEFPLRIQVCFQNPLSKPVNIIHNLKLDQSYTGLQTLGAETIVDVMVYNEEFTLPTVSSVDDLNLHVKSEEGVDSELIPFTKIKTEVPSSASDSEPPIIDTHDYSVPAHLIKTETEERPESPIPEAECVKSVSPKTSDCAVIPSAEPSLPSNRPRVVTSLASSSVPSTISKPVLVRCLNKNGTVINLPLALLRKAVVIKPYRLAKPGESLLRHPLMRTATETPVAVQLVKPCLTEAAVATPGPSSPTTKLLDTKRSHEKSDAESRLIIERRCLTQILEEARSTRWLSVRDCVRMLARHFNLIDPKASNPTYRSVRPFSSSSLECFSSWNIGKQRSSEWMRAKLIHQTLEQCHFSNGVEIWKTKAIMNWCRRQGYSPLSCWPGQQTTPTTTAAAESDPLPSTLSAIKIDLPLSVKEDDDVTVEVERVENEPTKLTTTSAHVRKSLIPLDDPDPEFTAWIADSIDRLGFKLGAEVHEDSFVPIARHLMSHIWKELASDLVRRSLRETWQRNSGQKPDQISLSDTFQALNRRPEFDVFTNAGLGLNESV